MPLVSKLIFSVFCLRRPGIIIVSMYFKYEHGIYKYEHHIYKYKHRIYKYGHLFKYEHGIYKYEHRIYKYRHHIYKYGHRIYVSWMSCFVNKGDMYIKPDIVSKYGHRIYYLFFLEVL